MATVEKVGHDEISNRDLFVLDLPRSKDLPARLQLTTPRFVCLVAWDARSASVDQISKFAQHLLSQGAVYICTWGPNCKLVHDIVDDERLGPDSSPDISGVVMTTWHTDDSLAEAIRFAMVDAWPDELKAEGCGSVLGVVVGSSSWAAEIRAAFSDPRRFISSLDSDE